MSEEKLYLVEVLLEKVSFEPAIEAPKKRNLHVNIKLGSLIDVVLKGDIFAVLEDNCSKEEYNLGKSILFACKPNHLIESFTKNKLVLEFLEEDSLLGVAKVAMEVTQNPSKAMPKELKGSFPILNNEEIKIAMVKIFVRISNYDKSIESQYHVNETERVVIQNSDQNSANVICEFQDKSKIIPIVALCNASLEKKARMSDLSWTALFHTDITPRASVAPIEFHQPEMRCTSAKVYGFESMMSICLRPREKKFFNITTLSDASFNNDLETTSERIRQNLCENKDCPAVLKFKEYGLGPLATGKGLGTVYGEVKPPVTYGLSQTYGTMNQYGPYGVLEEDEELGVQEVLLTDPSYPLRLLGGGRIVAMKVLEDMLVADVMLFEAGSSGSAKGRSSRKKRHLLKKHRFVYSIGNRYPRRIQFQKMVK